MGCKQWRSKDWIYVGNSCTVSTSWLLLSQEVLKTWGCPRRGSSDSFLCNELVVERASESLIWQHGQEQSSSPQIRELKEHLLRLLVMDFSKKHCIVLVDKESWRGVSPALRKVGLGCRDGGFCENLFCTPWRASDGK